MDWENKLSIATLINEDKPRKYKIKFLKITEINIQYYTL